MLQKVVNLILNWFVNYMIIPISMVVIDYFHMKKTIKDLNVKVKTLEDAKTTKEKDDAIDNMP